MGHFQYFQKLFSNVWHGYSRMNIHQSLSEAAWNLEQCAPLLREGPRAFICLFKSILW